MPGPRRWVATAVVLALASPAVAWAGGPDLDDDPDTARIVRAWRRQGAAAIPALVNAVCKDGPAPFQAAGLLAGLGEPTIAPLFEAQVRRSRECLRPPLATLGEVIHAVEGRRYQRERPRPSPTTRGLLGALASADSRRVAAGLDVLEEVARPSDWESESETQPDREAVAPFLRAAVAPLLKRLERSRGAERNRVLAVLEALGEAAAAAAPAVVELLADPEAAYAAAGAAGALGAPAAGAVPALRRLLAAPAERHRRLAVVTALGRLGPAAHAALPELHAHLDVAARQACDGSLRGSGLAETVTAILAVDPRGGARFAAQITDALDRLRRCQGGEQEEALFRALRPGPATVRTAAILRVVRDEGRSPYRRDQAANALGDDTPAGRAPRLPDADIRLIARLRTPRGQPETSQQVPSDRPSLATQVAQSLTRCQRQAGMSGVVTSLPPGAHPAGEDDDFIRCLGERLCGPAEREYRRTVGLCCRYAYSATKPPWCRP